MNYVIMEVEFLWRIKMKRTVSALFVLIVLTALLTACGGTKEIDYEYQGFVIEVYENAKGETAIVTICGDVESNFVIKENTKMIAPAQKPVAVGDCILLNTKREGDEDIKECKVLPGFVNEGRLVYVEGDDSPYILAELLEGRRLFAKLIDDGQNLQPGTSGMGDVIRVYHRDVVDLTDPTIAVEGLIYVENGSSSDLTDEDIAFIVSEGYTLRAE